MPDRPNVLLIMADQHNARFLGREDHPDVLTPHLDRLADRGVRFARAYCQSGICVPSRCSLFSGLYPRSLGCMRNDDSNGVMEEVFSMQNAFCCNGYSTAAFGKRHLDQACDAGWDMAASHLFRESPDDNYVHWIHRQGLGEAFDRDWAAEFAHGPPGAATEGTEMPISPLATHESRLPDGTTMEAWTKHRTIEFLEQQKTRANPFFCFASFYRPHQPYTPISKHYSRYDRTHWGKGRRAGDGISRPPAFAQPVSELPPRFQTVFQGVNRVFCLDKAREDEQLYRDYIAAYCALVEEVDEHVGDILCALDALGLRDNTCVIYASDHGDFVGAHGMIEKCAAGHNIYEETLRVPLIFSGPQVCRGSVCNGIVELLDIYPTLIDLCGLRLPRLKHPLQGRSLSGVLTGADSRARSFSVSENWTQATVITDRYKLGVWQKPLSPKASDYRAFGDMLFDLVEDPHEVQNLAGGAAHAAIEAGLGQTLREWQAQTPSAPHERAISSEPRV